MELRRYRASSISIRLSRVNMILSLFLLAFAAFSSVSARFSGIYYDNGVDQTVIQKLLTRQEKREVEREILNLLGLPSRPRPRRTSNVDLGSSAPKFLLDIYKSLLDNPSSRAVRSKLTLSGRDQQAIDESDVIMSFLPQGMLFTNLTLLTLWRIKSSQRSFRQS